MSLTPSKMCNRLNKQPPFSLTRYVASVVLASVVLAPLVLLGCQDAPPASPPQKTVEIRFVFPTEASEFVSEVLTGLQVQPLTLRSGEKITVVPVAIEGTKAIFSRMASGDIKPALWLDTSDASSEVVSQQITSLSGEGLRDCRSLLSTKNVLVRRVSDPLHALVAEGESGSLSFRTLVSDGDLSGLDSKHGLLIPNPRTSVSGLSSLLGIVTALDVRPPHEVSAESVRLKIPELRKTQSRVVQYMYSDKRMLDWLSQQEGGEPLIALSNEQQFRNFMREYPDSSLQSHPIRSEHVASSYPLCLVAAPWVSRLEQSAAAALHRQLFLPEVRNIAKRFGFSVEDASPNASPQTERVRGDVAKVVLNSWGDLRKPAKVTVVIDTSASMAGPNLEMLARDVSLFLSSADTGVGVAPTSIITFDSSVQVIRKGITEPRELSNSLRSLKALGASSVRDGVLKGIEIAAENGTEDVRRVVLVIVDGKDTSSRTTPAAFQLAAAPIISGKRIVLYVVGVGEDQEDYSGLPALVSSVGGLWRTAKLSTLGGDLYSLWPDLK
jgi:Mg-chelatase subunit ChlD